MQVMLKQYYHKQDVSKKNIDIYNFILLCTL